jgi:hypothetical protein
MKLRVGDGAAVKLNADVDDIGSEFGDWDVDGDYKPS